jgi:hypothetical protein
MVLIRFLQVGQPRQQRPSSAISLLNCRIITASSSPIPDALGALTISPDVKGDARQIREPARFGFPATSGGLRTQTLQR